MTSRTLTAACNLPFLARRRRRRSASRPANLPAIRTCRSHGRRACPAFWRWRHDSFRAARPL